MAKLAIGSVVLIQFPFSDLSSAKLRPAVVLAASQNKDWILCQITSNPYSDKKSIQINDLNFKTGALPLTSYARVSKLFTANEEIIVKTIGLLDSKTTNTILKSTIKLFEISLSSL